MIETAPVSAGSEVNPSYINLTLVLDQPQPDQLAITLEGAKRSVGPLAIKYPAAELEQLVAQLREVVSLPPDAQRTLGITLGDLLLPAETIRPAFQQIWRTVVERQGYLRLRLRIVSAALGIVPWEYAQVPLIANAQPQPLLYDPRISFARLDPTPMDVAPSLTDDQLPLEVLLVLAGPDDLPPLKLAKEEKRVTSGLAQLPEGARGTPHILHPARWSELVDALTGNRRADLLHFAGHGYHTADEAGLVFHDDEEPGRSHQIAASEIAARLRGKGVKVVVLSACESARLDPGRWGGVALELLRAGVPAVVAMQFEVGDSEATAFASGFYTALATGAPLDVAVAEGRLRMASSVPATTGWGCPVLYMQTTNAQLFNFTAPAPPAVAAARAALVVNQALGLVAGKATGFEIGTLRLEQGQLIVNQQVSEVAATGEVRGFVINTLDLSGANPEPLQAMAAAHQPSTDDAALRRLTERRPSDLAPSAMPPARPADPQAAAHLQPTETTVSPTIGAAHASAYVSAAVRSLLQESVDFVGRARVRAAIEQFLSVRNHLLVIVGPPESGKTALMARLLLESQSSANPWLYAFCGVDEGDNPHQFIEQLAKQLAQTLDNYTIAATAATGGTTLSLQAHLQVGENAGQVVGNQIGELAISDLHPREAFRRLIQEPLRNYQRELGPDGRPRPLVIAVDALDRAWEWDGGQSGNIVMLLSEVQDLPSWINFVCTARPGAAVQTLRLRGGVQYFDLTEHPADNDADIALFLAVQLGQRFSPALQAALAAQLAALPATAALAPEERIQALIARIVLATEGSFLFARRYVATLATALSSTQAQDAVDAAALLAAPASLDQALESAYGQLLAQVQQTLDRTAHDADEAVLALLATTFAPLELELLTRLAGFNEEQVIGALGRLKSILAPLPAGSGAPAYALYSRSFAEHVRKNLPEAGRVWDRQIAESLELIADTGNPAAQNYRARFRWRHLQRGLQLVASATPQLAQTNKDTGPLITDLEKLKLQVPDPLLRARVLRAQAIALLDPGSMRDDAWQTALTLLKWAEDGVNRSRALAPLRRRRQLRVRQVLPQTEQALAELERTLVARGDAYTMISNQLLGTDELRPLPTSTFARWLVISWGLLIRLPVLLYSLPRLLLSGVRPAELLASLQYLERGQDWSVVQLVTHALMLYRRAAELAESRGDVASSEEITDRIGQLFVRLGAFHSAARIFNTLLAGPSTLDRPWQEAIWRLRLGEVLTRLRDATRASPLLESALRQFMIQDSPTLIARTANALMRVHIQQATVQRLKGDDRAAATYEDLALRRAEDGLAAWQRLGTLEGDELSQLDPALGASRLAGHVWRLSQSDFLAEEQQRRAQNLLAQIPERHFAQRFDHPLLRAFRILAMSIVPLVLLIGLLFAVQSPSTLVLVPRSSASFQPPLVNMSDFPDNLLRSNRELKNAADLVQTIKSVDSIPAVRAGVPTFDAAGIFWKLGLVCVGSLLAYIIVGIIFIHFSTPEQYQGARPGRLILTPEGVIWRGMPRSGDRWLAWRAVLRDAWLVVYRRIVRRPLPRAMAQRAASESALVPPTSQTLPRLQDHRLLWSDLARVVVVERRVDNGVVYDVSQRLLIPTKSAEIPISVDGSIARYDELVSEIEHRVGNVAHHRLTGELFRSFPGVVFMFTLCTCLTFLALALLYPPALRLKPGNGPFHFSELYVLATPGISLPLMWWFVVQPLQVSMARAANLWPAMLVLVTGIAISLLIINGVDFSLVGLEPDFLLPLAGIGALLAALGLAQREQRYRQRSTIQRRVINYGMLLGVALPLWICLMQTWTLVQWCANVVLGNRMIELAVNDVRCSTGTGCGRLTAASRFYEQMIELRPANFHGYDYRGFTALMAGDTEEAQQNFSQAIALLPPLSIVTEQDLRSKLGEVSAREARAATDPMLAAQAFEEALAHFKQVVPFTKTDTLRVLRSGEERYALQQADVWYSRALRQIVVLQGGSKENYYVNQPPNQDTRALRAWEDLNQAIQTYEAINVLASPSSTLYRDSQIGLATAWLARGEFPTNLRPADQPGPRGSFVRARDSYAAATAFRNVDPEVYGGQAWNAIRLDAWDDALRPLEVAQRVAPADPRYPALAGLSWWLHSDDFTQTDPGYHRALNHAVEEYTTALQNAEAQAELLARASRTPENPTPPCTPELDVGPYYATRSILFYKLRNTTTAKPFTTASEDVPANDGIAAQHYADSQPLPPPTKEDYEIWMRRAMQDMDQALALATVHRCPITNTLGYYYWRGRLHVALGLTWQRHLLGTYSWRSVAPEYAAAIQDFTAATNVDPDPNRRNPYSTSWMVWARWLARHAAHMAFAEEAIALGLQNPGDSPPEYERAVRELGLVNPDPDVVRRWDPASAPSPDYSYMSGFLALATSRPITNPLLGPDTYSATLLYRRAISDTETVTPLFVPSRMRAEVYGNAICQLIALQAAPPPNWPQASRAEAVRIQETLTKQRALIKSAPPLACK